MDYKEQLKHPKWQKKRLEIMERDGFQCQCCYSKEETLAVHHKKYIKGNMPWEYHSDLLITLCNECHCMIHEEQKNENELLYNFMKEKLTYTDYFLIGKKIADIFTKEGYLSGYKNILKRLTSQYFENR